MIKEFKPCRICLQVKALHLFHKQPKCKDGHFNVCKICAHARLISYRKDPEKKKKFCEYGRNSVLKKRYGLCREEFERMKFNQNNQCLICGNSPNMEGPVNQRTLSVDHCHKTGKIRGLLCQLCNRGIGLFRERQDLLINACEYLKNHD